ncbi:hypothetical protein CYMTET_26038 [Cymbomonas tetramitiformis]|uniref:Uncharacterized protein n=1 Tax=Cymbomonas tetramitiformis TaxID=36881 RepID=A0AAE0KYA6_9CHLO|nr:hypothetical protein CYMTET_26038 [Cymbomonas tetramitiformis]
MGKTGKSQGDVPPMGELQDRRMLKRYMAVLRATLDVKEGVTLDMLDISGCKRLSWDAVRGALPNMGRVGRLRMRGGPLVTARSVAATHKLLAELGACTAAASLSLALRHDEGSLRHSVDQYLSAILSTAARDLKIEALELDLEDEETGTEGAMALAAALTPHEQDMLIWSLRTLNLAGNQLCGVDDDGDGTYDASGIEALADALAFNTSLNTLNLAGNNLCGIRIIGLDEDGEGTYDASGIKALAEALVFNGSLNTLNLRSNDIGPEGARALAVALTPNAQGVFNGSLNTLDLAHNHIDELDRVCNFCGYGVELPIGALRKNEITELDLSDKELRPEDAIILGAVSVSNKSLNTLDLSCNELCGLSYDDGVELPIRALRKNEITELDLSDKELRPEDAIILGAVLVSNKSLNTLDLYWNGIGPEGAKALAAALTPNEQGVFNTSLNTLNLAGDELCGVDYQFNKIMMRDIKDGKVTELDLSGKGIGVPGARVLSKLLVFNTSLNTLDLRNNDIGPEGAKALAVALTPNAEGVFNTSLNTLKLAYNQLCGLDYRGRGTYDASGIKALADALVFNTSLNTLDVRMNNITGDAAQQLAEAVLKHPCIKEFNEIRMQDIKDDKVAELDLREEGIGVLGALVLSKLLVFNGSLNTLNLYNNNIEPEGAKALAVALTPNALGVFNGSLNTLNLERNDIGPEGAKALAVALTPNAEGVFNGSLNSLNLYWNGIGREGAKALAVALTPNEKGVFNTSLNTLSLAGNDIGDEGAKALAVALTPNAEGVFNGSLNTLSLRINKIGPEGAKALAAALTPNEQGVFNTSLNTLNLTSNAIRAEGAKALAVALTPNAEGVFNTSLNTLELADNQLCCLDWLRGGTDASGIKALADALVFNTSLNTLNLDRNGIGDEARKALLEAGRSRSSDNPCNVTC